MEQVRAVQRMQDYIGAHLEDTITLADLAKVSYYSPWHSYRIFCELTHLTPADYIRKLRLSVSALELRDSECKVVDVALKYGYGSTDGYQRAFFREFGCNPREYADHPVPIGLFTPYGVIYQQPKEDIVMEKVKHIFIQVVERPKRKVILKRGVKAEDYFAYCEEVGCDVWGILASVKPLCGEPAGMWLPRALVPEGTSRYVQGVEVPPDYDGPVPEGFELIELPESKYLMFQGEPFAEEDFCAAIDELRDAIDRYDLSVTGCELNQTNPRIQLEPVGTRGYIELVPVKQRG